jgi:hypothetical protein
LLVALLSAEACGADAGSAPARNGHNGGETTGGGVAGAGGDDVFGNVVNKRTGTGGSGATGTGGKHGGDDCVATGAEATIGREPADMVWVVDNSCSMAQEAVAVQTNMNRFAQALFDQGIDVHMVLLSSANIAYQTNPACAPLDFVCALGNLAAGGLDFGVCVSAPFGSGNCPDDSKMPNFLHLPVNVDSVRGLSIILDNYPQYASMMRPNASKHFAIVTDDQSIMDAATFTAGVGALDPTLFAAWRFHGIFSFTQCPSAATVGTVYQELATQTGGVAADLCLQDFDPVFDALAKDVVMNADIACDWAIPTPPTGQTLDPDKVNVNFTQPDGVVVPLGRIPPGEMCNGREGWYYDDDSKPMKVISCPMSCDRFKAAGGKVDVLFGCSSHLVN